MQSTFPGKDQIVHQLRNAEFEIIDRNGSLKINPQVHDMAMVEKTIPVEAWSIDKDGMMIQVLLFTREGEV